MDRFCVALKQHHVAGEPFNSYFTRCAHPRTGKSSNLYLGFQCFSADTIASFLFATTFDQLSFPDFHGDLIEGVDVAMPTVTLAKFSAVFVWIIHNFPEWLLKITSPRLNGVVIFRKVSLMTSSPRLL